MAQYRRLHVQMSRRFNGSVVAEAARAGKSLRQAARAAEQNLTAGGERKFSVAQLANIRLFLKGARAESERLNRELQSTGNCR